MKEEKAKEEKVYYARGQKDEETTNTEKSTKP
jgi:hypothetical protein